MTDKEKAKAYDEAIERAKKQRADYQKELDKTDKNSQLAGLLRAGISAIDMDFPELAESEDERIIKTLQEYVKNRNWPLNGPTQDEVLAYLEKQKEIPMPNSTELIEMWDNEKKMLKEKDFRGDEWRLAYNAFMDGFARGTCVTFEKQKEQKLVENPFDANETMKMKDRIDEGFTKIMRIQ